MTKQVKCLIRKTWVAATPEEMIRQQLLLTMVHRLEYPLETLVVEKNLRQMPHLQFTSKDKIPDRRFDLIVFSKEIHPKEEIYPLLLIECKAVPLTSKVITQVAGYNHYLKAHFICIANGEEIQTGWYDLTEKMYQFQKGLTSFHDLKKLTQNRIINSMNR